MPSHYDADNSNSPPPSPKKEPKKEPKKSSGKLSDKQKADLKKHMEKVGKDMRASEKKYICINFD